MTTIAFEPGTLLAGKLRVRGERGRGGMGVVLEAHDEVLDRTVAVKLMIGDTTPESRARFLREARAAAALRSEHAVDIYEVGELADGTPFIVTELLEGMTLDAFLEKSGVASLSDAVRFIADASQALEEAHAIGLIHRDVKLANMFLANRINGSSIVKVIDFGIVKDTRPAAELLTVTGEGFGSPAYMSPEQVKGLPLDARSDVWSLGVCLFELLTGGLPFDGVSVPNVLLAVINAEAPRVSSLRRDVPQAIDDVVMRCLAKDPAKRFASAAELLAALPNLPRSLQLASETVDRAAAVVLTQTESRHVITPPRMRAAPPNAFTKTEYEKQRTTPQHHPPKTSSSRVTTTTGRSSASSPPRAAAPLAFIYATAVLAVLVVGMGIVLYVMRSGMKSVEESKTTPPLPSSIITVPTASASASASATVIASTPPSASSKTPAPQVAPVRPAVFVINGVRFQRLGGNADVPNPPTAIVNRIHDCLDDHRCPSDLSVRIHLAADEDPRGVFDKVLADKPFCRAAITCVISGARFWPITCAPGTPICERYVDVSLVRDDRSKSSASSSSAPSLSSTLPPPP